MCPDKKLDWFNKNPDWRDEGRVEAQHVVTQRWSETYALTTTANLSSTQSSSRLPAVCVAVDKILLTYLSY
jgi:hypothetical protein